MHDNQTWPTYLINVPGNSTRYSSSVFQLDNSNIHYTLLKAVNGLTLSQDEIRTVYSSSLNRRHYKAPLTPQEIGCYLSHRKAWHMLLSSEFDYALVLEDDFLILKPNILKKVVDSLSPLTTNIQWDIVKLFLLKEPKSCIVVKVDSSFSIIQTMKVPTCMTAYLVSREGARKLLNSRSKFFRPVDEDVKYYWEHGINVYSVKPALVGIGEQHAELGTVGVARRESKKSFGSTRKLLIQLNYQLIVRLLWTYRRIKSFCPFIYK